MTVPAGIAVIDTMIGLPSVERRDWYESMSDVLRDEGSKTFRHPAGYMFKDTPTVRREPDSIDQLLHEMDRFGIERGLVPVALTDELHVRAISEHPDRLHGSVELDPNLGMEAIRELERAVGDHGVIAAQFFPAGKNPPVPINDRRAYPIYAKCVELDIPVFVQAGVPGPRVPMDSQYPGLVDEVCYDFPELRFVFRHGCEPWIDLTVKLLLKWPNLYYSTTAFAPKYYPEAIVQYANTRGADKIIYGGYYPWGFELERTFQELAGVPFKAEVWPKFLRANAARVLHLPE
ncbi:MAG: amidohydrolase family protein [Acidimicrobiia bacterium]